MYTYETILSVEFFVCLKRNHTVGGPNFVQKPPLTRLPVTLVLTSIFLPEFSIAKKMRGTVLPCLYNLAYNLDLKFSRSWAIVSRLHGFHDFQAIRTTNIIVSSLRFLNSYRASVLEPEVFHLNPKKSDNNSFRRFTR